MADRQLPRSPLLDAASLRGTRAADVPAFDDLPQQRLTTSGRAAFYQALQELALAPGSAVLLPSYHCPTMVAPVVGLGLRPVFYPLDRQLAPRLEALDPLASDAGALLVAHFFGMPRSLSAERAWCDSRGLALIEDCAHSFFGLAGERAVGQWGDFSVASVTKFFPVLEAGLLASSRCELRGTVLPPQGHSAEWRGLARLLLDSFARPRRLHHRAKAQPALAAKVPQAVAALPNDPLQSCDLRRAELRPLWHARWLLRCLPRSAALAARRDNAALLLREVRLPGWAHWERQPTPDMVPYALPLWLDRDADEVYQGLRAAGMPVFRWDQRWAGMPALPDDRGTEASSQLLQLLCHQSLRPKDMHQFAEALNRWLHRPAP